MKPFVFKLQMALDLKLKEEDDRKEKLHRQTELYQAECARLNELVARLNQVYALLRDKQSTTINVMEVKEIVDYVPVLRERISRQEETTEASRMEMEQARLRLLATVKERKAIEKLREKHYQRFLQECLRQEQKEIDEMASVGFAHRN